MRDAKTIDSKACWSGSERRLVRVRWHRHSCLCAFQGSPANSDPQRRLALPVLLGPFLIVVVHLKIALIVYAVYDFLLTRRCIKILFVDVNPFPMLRVVIEPPSFAGTQLKTDN